MTKLNQTDGQTQGQTEVLAVLPAPLPPRFVRVFIANLLLVSAAAAAEPAKIGAIPQVLMITPATPALEQQYQPMPTQAVTMPALNNWRDANSRVKELGGWMFYASEADAGHQPAKQPAKNPAPQPTKPTTEPASEHKHHHHHHPAAKAAEPLQDQP
jgi:hypothetical protein